VKPYFTRLILSDGHSGYSLATQFKQRLNTWRLGGLAAWRENHLFFISCSSLGQKQLLVVVLFPEWM
jgi:hypothetical protein